MGEPQPWLTGLHPPLCLHPSDGGAKWQLAPPDRAGMVFTWLGPSHCKRTGLFADPATGNIPVEPCVIQLTPGYLLPTGTRVLTPSHSPCQPREQGHLPSSSQWQQLLHSAPDPWECSSYQRPGHDQMQGRPSLSYSCLRRDETKGGNTADGDRYLQASLSASRTGLIWDHPLLLGTGSNDTPGGADLHL